MHEMRIQVSINHCNPVLRVPLRQKQQILHLRLSVLWFPREMCAKHSTKTSSATINSAQCTRCVKHHQSKAAIYSWYGSNRRQKTVSLCYYVGYTRARKARLICNVDDGYRALQIQRKTHDAATSKSPSQYMSAAEQQTKQTAHIDDMSINLLLAYSNSNNAVHPSWLLCMIIVSATSSTVAMLTLCRSPSDLLVVNPDWLWVVFAHLKLNCCVSNRLIDA